MRISTRLTAVVASVFLIVGAVGALALVRLRDTAQSAIEMQARHFATAVATMAAYQIENDRLPQHSARFQDLISFIAAREQRDLEVVDPQLVIVADVDHADIGQPIEAGARRAVIARTLADGETRLMTEARTAQTAQMRQVVVPIFGARRAILGALVYEYTPLYDELAAHARRSLALVGLLAVVGLLLALGCALYIARRVSRPIVQLTEAARALSQGRRNVSVNAGTGDEIGELATVFNSMSAALGRSEASLELRASDLQRANQALHLRERAMASSFNAIVIGNLSQPGFPIEYVNPAFVRITGYSAAEALGMASDFLAGDERDQPPLHELRLALRERREAHAVLRSYRKDGTPFWNEVYVAPVRDSGEGDEHFVAIFNDVTNARKDAEQVAHQAQFDGLTGLANRSLLLDRLNQAMATARRGNDSLMVAFIDLDDFKLVNDNLGHDVGDQLLKVIAERLQGCVRASDTVARFGGDEFVLLLLNQGDPAGEGRVAELVRKLLDRIGESMALAGHHVKVSCSIGLAGFPQDGQDADTLIKHADTAMYRAKELGRNGFQFFTEELQERAQRQLELGASLRLALERDEFELHYQPQVNLRSGKVVGVEALLRWRHPEQGLLGPGHFIGFAEETGLIIPIGEWVLRSACAQNKAWQDAGLAPMPVAVNVSAKQCAQQDLEAVVRRALDASGLAARYLELELTESISMAEPEKSVPMMARLKQIGVLLAIDDFGTGYSNMSYLRRFPIDRLKLDISFVRDIATDPSSLAISDAIITMAHSLHLEVVAEGVETPGQLALLAGRHCDIIQGFYFSKPLAVPELEQLLRDGRQLPAGLAGAPALLVLDDDPHLLAYLELILSASGYVVHATTSPELAFELLACNQIAVLLCDQRMPDMSGVEFLSRVRRMHPRTVRIMLSAFEDYHVTRQAINMGSVYKFLSKPIDQEELKQVVEEALRHYLGSGALKLA